MRVSLAIACKFKNLGFNRRAAQGGNWEIRRKAVEYHFWPFGECWASRWAHLARVQLLCGPYVPWANALNMSAILFSPRSRLLALALVAMVALAAVYTSKTMDQPVNVLGSPLAACCTDPMTGYYRDGFCNTGAADVGTHVVCAVMTEEFLAFTRSRGNDLSTPNPAYRFPGLQPGDGWCLCALRWREAWEAGVAPPVRLAGTHAKALQYIPLEVLQDHALTE